MNKADVIIIGAGAAGLMCAIEAAKRKRKVIVLDHANKAGKKILMSGGGRCNFTNLDVTPDNFISHNPHFCKSALSQYTAWDFIELVKSYDILFHEKVHGQLFCDNKSKEILDMLLSECHQYGVEVRLKTIVESVAQAGSDENAKFLLCTNNDNYACDALVIATGGLSIPTMGASPFGYQIAEQFGIKVWPTRAGLVPFTLQPELKNILSQLSGVSVESIITSKHQSFNENILFTHRGLSGPAVLQISSYWQPGETVDINMLPQMNLVEALKTAQKQRPSLLLKTFLSQYLPKRVVSVFVNESFAEQSLQSCSHRQFELIAQDLQAWALKPNGTEGYRTAEVTLGGVDCNAISSKTMETKNVPGLFFIGEVLDVTGWLGGYNFQWAWSTGWVAGQVV